MTFASFQGVTRSTICSLILLAGMLNEYNAFILDINQELG